MKKLILSGFFTFCAIVSFAQFVIVPTATPNQYLQPKGMTGGKLGFQLPIVDTLNNPAKFYFGALTLRPQDTLSSNPQVYMSVVSKWIPFQGTSGGGGGNHTIYTELPLAIKYVNGDTILYQLHDDGFVIKPIVTWSGFGLTYYATNGVYYIGGKYFESPSTTITLSPADSVYSTQYVFVVDTLGRTTFIRGIPASLLLLPADTLGYQLPITSGITITAGATTPTATVFTVPYDEGVGEPSEWTYADNGGISAYTTNTANYFTGSHSTLISTYTTNSRFYWYDNVSHNRNNNEVFNFHIWLNTPMTNSIYFSLIDGVGFATNQIRLGTAQGFNPNATNQWQNISVPASTFNWLSTQYNTLAWDMVGSDVSGTGGFFIDYVNIQAGNNLPNPGDWRTRISNDSLFQAINGTDTYIGAVGGGSGGSGTVSSIGLTSSNLTIGGTSSPITSTGTFTVDLPNTAVTPGSYTNANVTFDAQGRATAASNGSGGNSPSADQQLTATASQTAFTFTGLPSSYNDFWIDGDGVTINQNFYTKSLNTITLTTGLGVGTILTLHFK